ncbi:hypothetical protein ACFL5O_03395 [Myxococcota bacterium]
MNTPTKSASIACLVLATGLRAPDAESQETTWAKALYREAKALMAQNVYPEACPKLEESQRLEPSVGTLFLLGECYEQNGQVASAWAAFQKASDAALDQHQPGRQRLAEERAALAGAKAPKVTINVAPEARVEGLEVKLNGVLLGEAAWGIAAPMDPGEYTVEARAPGYQAWTEPAVVQPGATSVTVTVPELPPEAPLEPAIAKPPPPPLPRPKTVQSLLKADTGPAPTGGAQQRIVGLAVAGVGVGGLVAGTVFGVRAQSKEKDSEAHCWPEDKSLCSAKGVALLDDAAGAATVANVGFIVGGLSLAGGAALFLTADQPTTAAAIKPRSVVRRELRVAPVMGARTTGVSVSGTF